MSEIAYSLVARTQAAMYSYFMELVLTNLWKICIMKYALRSFKYFYLFLYAGLVWAQDVSNISGVDDMLIAGQSMLKVAAKWGGILTVVVSALALGSGRLEGALAQTVCKVLVVVGLLMAAMSFFGNKISWGFAF